MFGIFRNSVRLSSKAVDSFQPSKCFSGHGNVNRSYSLQQCNVINANTFDTLTPSWLQVSARCFGTLKTLGNSNAWKPENCGLLRSEAHFPEMAWSGNSMINLGDLNYVPVRGMKFKGKVKRRCKDCYLMYVNGMLYNLCKTHPRHKHGLKPPYFSNQRLLTHAMMSPKRPY